MFSSKIFSNITIAMKEENTIYRVHTNEVQLTASSVEYAAVQFGTDQAEIEVQEGESIWNWSVEREGETIDISVEPADSERAYRVYIKGEALTVQLETARDQHLKGLSVATASGRVALQLIRAPMPGLLKSVLVSVGQKIEKGESLCILEAMKMENEIKSPGNFIVGSIAVEPGNPVEKGTTLMQLLPAEG